MIFRSTKETAPNRPEASWIQVLKPPVIAMVCGVLHSPIFAQEDAATEPAVPLSDDAMLYSVGVWQYRPSFSLVVDSSEGELAPGDVDIEPGFNPHIYQYLGSSSTTSLTLRAQVAKTSEVSARLVGKGSGSSLTLKGDTYYFYGVTLSGLRAGVNTVEVEVVAEAGNSQVYTINIDRSTQVETYLIDLQLWSRDNTTPLMFDAMDGRLDSGDVKPTPAFDPKVRDYTASVSGSQLTIRSGVDGAANLSVSGKSSRGNSLQSTITNVGLNSGAFQRETFMGLTPGINVFTLRVSEGSSSKVYTINVDAGG